MTPPFPTAERLPRAPEEEEEGFASRRAFSPLASVTQGMQAVGWGEPSSRSQSSS